MIIKEFEAMNYSFFRFPAYISLLLSPIIIGVVSFYLADNMKIGTGNSITGISEDRNALIKVYYTTARLAMIVVLSFFVSFRWSAILNDGSYGFWLIQGIDRSKFFVLTFTRFFTTIFLSVLVGLMIILFPGGLDITNQNFMKHIILIFVGMYFLTSTAVLTGELIRDPERSLMIFIFVQSFFILLNQNTDNIYFQILFSENQFDIANPLNIVVYTFLLSSLILGVSFQIHKKRDIQM